jgi:hypothetical protein
MNRKSKQLLFSDWFEDKSCHAFPEYIYLSFFIYCLPLICFVALSSLADSHGGLWSWWVLLLLTPVKYLPTSLRMMIFEVECSLYILISVPTCFKLRPYHLLILPMFCLPSSFMMTEVDISLKNTKEITSKHRNRRSANNAQSLVVAFLPIPKCLSKTIRVDMPFHVDTRSCHLYWKHVQPSSSSMLVNECSS